MDFITLFKRKQLPLLPKETELTEKDFKKIQKHLENKDIFGTECSEWSGVFCNKGKEKKGIYINYYFNHKKESLHRLLYRNYVNAKLPDKTYLVHKCSNKLCCNVGHMVEKRLKDLPKKEDIHKINFDISF